MAYISPPQGVPMQVTDRRLGVRVPLEMFLTSYLKERPIRGLTCDVSDTGLRLQTVKTAARPDAPAAGHAVVGLEFELPGTGEVIWARGEICYERGDALAPGVGYGVGVRFTAMPLVHARLVRDYCVERRRSYLASLLERIPRARR
jgi:hypothetical protein